MLKKLFKSWCEKKQIKDIKNFIAILSSISNEGMTDIVSAVFQMQKNLIMVGWDVSDPIKCYRNDPTIIITLVDQIKLAQEENKMVISTSISVWAHSLRAQNTYRMHQLGKIMWQELARGFFHSDHNFPVGLNPNKVEDFDPINPN